MKTMIWQSEQRQLELRTSTRRLSMIQKFLTDHAGEPAQITTVDGIKLKVILVSANDKALCVQIPPKESWLILPVSRIVAISIAEKNATGT